MKQSILFIPSILLILFVHFLNGQSITLDPLRKADQLFNEYSYAKAVELYKEALKYKDIDRGYLTNQIALCYKNLNIADSSELWFKKTLELKMDNPLNHYHLADALMINGKYDEAKYWFEEYLKSEPRDERAIKKLESLSNLKKFNQGLFNAKIERMTYNSSGLDFSPAFYKDGIVFVSSRPRNTWIQKEFSWDNSRFLDLYFADSMKATYLSEGLNTPYHEGPLVFYNNYKSVVYTRNNYDDKKLAQDDKGVTNLKLYFASWNEEKEVWDKEISFQYNSDDYSNGSPAITEDGKILIFSSDKPGGYGASDLYISEKTENGWSKPKNLGKTINTKGRDGFPFLVGHQLFFASDGREGLGGLDIYVIQFHDGKPTGKVKNIGTPFNSNYDDFGLIIKNGKGYFTSNRNKETNDDIYKFFVKEPQLVVIIGEVFDLDLNTGINDADVFFKNENGEYLYTRSAENGSYQILAPVGSSWNVFAGKFQYESVNQLITQPLVQDTLEMERLFLKKINFAEDETLNTSNLATIIDKRIKPYHSTSHFVDGFDAEDTLKFDIVYFDLDSYTVKDIYKSILDEAANFLIEHVDTKVVLASHTDSRASETYNITLSGKRSSAVEKYLIEKGVDPKRINKKNFGEQLLTNKCADGIECPEDMHQRNRRTEIYFIKKNRNTK